MENEKVRMILFALIASLCLFFVFKNQPHVPVKENAVDQVENDNAKSIAGDKNVSSEVSRNKVDEPVTKDKPEAIVEPPVDEKPVELVEKTIYDVGNTPDAEEKLITIETDKQLFEFTSKGGGLLRLDLKDFKKTYNKDSVVYSLVDMKNGYSNYPATFTFTGLDQKFLKATFIFAVEKNGDEQTLLMTSVQDGIEVQKRFVFQKGFYDFSYSLKVINHRSEEIVADVKFVGGVGSDFDFEHPSSAYSDQVVTMINEDGDLFAAGDVHMISSTYGARQGLLTLPEERFVMGPKRKSGKKHDEAKVVWAAIKNRYFTMILKPTRDDWSVFCENQNKNMKDKHQVKPLMTFDSNEIKLVKGESFEESFKIFAGPMQNGIINSARYEKDLFADVIDYGFMFPKFIKVFDSILNFIISMIGHSQYWLGIILLTLMVRLSMFPITRKSSLSQAKLQAVTPKMKALREKHKGSPKKLNEEMMKLYKEEGVNPFSSCLPMFIQMPIFIGLYWTFNLTFEVRFASFLWINDLAVADHLFHFGRKLPLMGEYFNLLPILYAVINFTHMSSMPTPQEDMQAQQQKIMKFMFPVMMLFFFYQMPSALVLYFIVSGTWSIVEQRLIKKKIEVLKAAAKS